MHDPIAYTYEADIHCPECARERFGSALDSDETEDNEGNSIGVIAPWSEAEYCDDGLYCGDCGECLVEPVLRSYGLGKYDRWIDAAVHAWTMDGTACAEQCGDCSSIGIWYGLVRGPIVIPQTAAQAEAQLTQFEIAYLQEQAGCIVSEDDRGFVQIEYYDTEDELLQEWRHCMDSAATDETRIAAENGGDTGV